MLKLDDFADAIVTIELSDFSLRRFRQLVSSTDIRLQKKADSPIGMYWNGYQICVHNHHNQSVFIDRMSSLCFKGTIKML